MEDYTKKNKPEGEEGLPEFMRLLNELHNEINEMGKHSLIISEKLNIIKYIDKIEAEDLSEKDVAPNDVLTEFWRCVDTIHKYNSRLNKSKLELIKLLG